ncbi:MAG TPA: DUF4105 domain-containing protein [Candidatus Enterocola sp.]|nr:DUF4105 domain-containing protein [Candidatus Enterocola sp.]
MQKRILLLIIICLSACPIGIYAFPQITDSAKVSILYCSPGEEIYELFGHTGLRVCDSSKNIDIVFNYGLFDFNQKDFIMRFVRGKTDYQVGVNMYNDFIYIYESRGSGINECVLDLSPEEKKEIIDYLLWNIKPENCVYRYNFIFNNCATKIRDIIEQSVHGKIIYPSITESISFREAIMQYTKNAAWSQFGFDICLGMGMDRMATERELMFLPENLNLTYAESTVVDSTYNVKNIVSSNEQIIPILREEGKQWFTPTLCGYILLALIIALSVFGYINHKSFKVFDITIFTINGLFGCVILFLILFSQHPFTNDNYNIIWLNPLAFFPLLTLIFKSLKKIKVIYYGFVSIVLTFFLVSMPIIPQFFNDAVVPFTLIYLVRSASHALYWGYHRNTKKGQNN